MTDIPRVKIDTDAEIEWIRLIERVAVPDTPTSGHVNLGVNGTTLTWVDDAGNVYTAATGDAPSTAKYILQTPDAALTNAQSLSALTTGLLKSTTVTGVLSIAVDGTDYVSPTGLATLTNKTMSGASNTFSNISAASIIAGTFGTGAYTFQHATATGIPLVVQSTDDSSSNPILRIANSAAANLSHFDYRGALIIGTKFSPASDIMNSTRYDVSATSGTYVAVGGQVQATNTGASTGTLHGFWFDVGTGAAASASIAGLVGMRTNIQMRSSSAPVTSYIGWYSRATWSTGITSTLTTLQHILLEAPNLGSGPGVITNLYGLYIGNMSAGSTINSAITTFAGNIVFNESGDANTDFRFEGDTNTHLIFGDAGAEMVSINQSSPAAKLDINQSSTTFATPVLKLTQSDVSEQFIKFTGTAANGVITQSLVDVGDAPTFTPVGYAKMAVDDLGNQIADGDYFVQFGTIA